MENSTSSCKSSMTMTAIGASIAMAPMTLMMFLESLSIARTDPDTVKILFFIQILGCALWSIGLFKVSGTLSRLGWQSGAAKTIGGAVAVVGLLQLVIFIAPKLLFRNTLYFGSSNASTIGWIIILIYFAIHITLWVATAKLSGFFPRLSVAINGYAILTIIPAILLIILLFALNNISYKTAKTLDLVFKIAFTVITIGVILCITGWWKAVGDADEIEAADNADEAQSQVLATVETTPQAAQPLTDGQKQSLMSLDDSRLQEIIANPGLFANPLYVAEADNILQKRRAWEALNGKSDEELMAIIQAPQGQYTYPTIDAASMELSSRRNPLFIAMIESYSTEDLKKMVADPGNYYDGYVITAREVLASRGL